MSDLQSNILNAQNLARWNGPLAYQLMKECTYRAQSPIEIDSFNRAATYMNETWDSIESKPYYAKQAKEEDSLWRGQKSRRVELIESDLTIEDYLAAKALSSQ